MSTKLSSTLAGRNPNFAPERQDSIVDKYHRPRVSVVVSHYNYSDFLFDALKSVQQQTYENFSCVVVDDFSKDHHFQSARESVGDLGDARFRIIRNASNSGQVQTFYHGIDEVESAFVSLLDPDDRYAPNFLECMLTAHLSSAIFCPLVCCEQHLTKSDGILTSLQKHWGLSFFEQERAEREVRCFETNGFHRFVYPTENGWHWTTSSSMLFRTDALKLIRPKKKLTYNAHADAYCAQGAHMLGGTILLNKPLVYRGLHMSKLKSALSLLAPLPRSMHLRHFWKTGVSPATVLELSATSSKPSFPELKCMT